MAQVRAAVAGVVRLYSMIMTWLLVSSLLSASPVGEARLPMPKGMAYKD
jgi:hypothetical protein